MLRYLSLRRYLPQWFRSEAGEFYLTIFSAVAAAAELTYWLALHSLAS